MVQIEVPLETFENTVVERQIVSDMLRGQTDQKDLLAMLGLS